MSYDESKDKLRKEMNSFAKIKTASERDERCEIILITLLLPVLSSPGVVDYCSVFWP